MNKVDLILDSGAYTAWKKQETLKVEGYIDFINKHKDCLWEYVNLDVIPGAFGKKPSRDEVEASAAKGWENLIKMRDAGLRAMPVFHMGERRYWLERMIGEGFDYIGISPANDRTTKQKQAWLDEIFGFLCGDKGFPQIRTHGFGMTSLPLLYRYPWFSADSVSWILFGAYGFVLIPFKKRDGVGYDYTTPPYTVHVSDRSSSETEEAPNSAAIDGAKMFDSVGPNMQKYIRNYLESEGFSLEVLRSSHAGRAQANCRFYRRISSSFELQPFLQHLQGGRGIFDHTEVSSLGSSTNLFGPLRLVFTTGSLDGEANLLNEEGIRERLISYYHIRDQKDLDLEHYVRYGFIPKRTKK